MDESSECINCHGTNLVFKKEKETKNTVRFQELSRPGLPPAIGTLYVQKYIVGESEKITVIIIVGE